MMGSITWWFSKLNKAWAVEFKDVYIGIPISWFICYLIFWYPFYHLTDVLSAVARTFIPVILIIKCHVSSRCIIMDFVFNSLCKFLNIVTTTELLRIFSCNLNSVSINNQLFTCFCELVVVWEVQVLYASNLGLA
ncbi:hypothetical protein NE237_019422 [Protea cynaroides]|uniref:Uncharacterized protein n=1 Tax=Protea cynaroides TaxID=273540 RepID=A0A9Q0QPZ9_9MAGN|nr:hypothetical protein NE237_019422 [Protea cynaroides]